MMFRRACARRRKSFSFRKPCNYFLNGMSEGRDKGAPVEDELGAGGTVCVGLTISR